MKPQLSIVIVDYKSSHLSKRLSAEFRKQKKWEVIIVNNDKINRGYGAGCNLGVARARGTYVLFLNPDVQIAPAAISHMMTYLERHPNVGVVGPKLRNSDGSTEQSSTRFPTPGTAAVALSFLNKLFPGNSISRWYWMSHWNRERSRKVDVVTGAVLMMRREDFLEVGGFDERFFLYWEEFDLCLRMKERGKATAYLAEAVATHSREFSMKKAEKNTTEVFRQSRWRYFRKHYGLVPSALLTLWLTIAEEWQMVFLALFSLFLRLYSLSTAPFIGDVGRDYLVAFVSLKERTLPLLGIPSSIPRFSQGPLNVWFDMLSFLLGGVSPYSAPLFAAVVTTLGVCLLYVFLSRQIGRWPAFVSSLLLVASPAAVAQSRMPFYLFAVPLFLLLYVWRIEVFERLRTGKTFFWVTLSFWLMFQWELATLPLIGLLPIAVWRSRLSLRRVWKPAVTASAIGLFPQMMFDVFHNCSQLCGLFAWSGYRVLSVFGFTGEHTMSLQRVAVVTSGVITQTKNIIGSGTLGLVIVLTISALCLIRLRILRSRGVVLGYALAGSLFLLIGILLHGAPSEAYFPPFFIFLPIFVGYGFTTLPSRLRMLAFALVSAVVIGNTVGFLTKSVGGVTVDDISHAASYIAVTSNSRPVFVRSSDQHAEVPTYLDNLRFMVQSNGVSIAPDGLVFDVSYENYEYGSLPFGYETRYFGRVAVSTQ